MQEKKFATKSDLKPQKLFFSIKPKNSYYSLIMTDIDYSNKNKTNQPEFIHWMIVNIPENKVKNGQTKIE